FFNVAAVFVVSTKVAQTVGKGMVDIAVVDPHVILGALLGAIIWNIITWLWGLPSSSTHALLGGFAGAAIAKAGFGAIIFSGWVKPILGIVVSPVLGVVLGFTPSVLLSWAVWKRDARSMEWIFRRLQLLSA